MKAIHALFAAALIAASFGAQAHQENHGKQKSAQVTREQKPWGIAGNAKSVTRTIQIAMSDNMRFTPDRVEVKQGETIRFVVRNTGKVLHEMVIGTRKELDEHAALMVKFPSMEHDEPYQAHVPAGKTGEMIWHFNRAGDFEFACLIAGHYQAGMVGKIKVSGAGK